MSWHLTHFLVSYHHDIIRRHGISHFRSKINQKHKVYHFYPFIKARNEKINELQAITFRDLSATSAETGLAPPKRAKRQKKKKIFQKRFSKNFGRRKIKSCKSSETCFPKVSRRSEPSSGGKRPFEIFTFCVRPSVRPNVRTSVRPCECENYLGVVLVFRIRFYD